MIRVVIRIADVLEATYTNSSLNLFFENRNLL